MAPELGDATGAGTVTADGEQSGVMPEEETEPSGPIILVVDDDPLLGSVVEACLELEGAHVRTAHTLEEARGELEPGLAHVVLDRRLPDGDGLELLPDLAIHCPETPVVVFTAFDDVVPPNLVSVPKTDMARLVDLLGLQETA